MLAVVALSFKTTANQLPSNWWLGVDVKGVLSPFGYKTQWGSSPQTTNLNLRYPKGCLHKQEGYTSFRKRSKKRKNKTVKVALIPASQVPGIPNFRISSDRCSCWPGTNFTLKTNMERKHSKKANALASTPSRFYACLVLRRACLL